MINKNVIDLQMIYKQMILVECVVLESMILPRSCTLSNLLQGFIPNNTTTGVTILIENDFIDSEMIVFLPLKTKIVRSTSYQHLELRRHQRNLKVPYYTVFHQYIIGLRYIQSLSLIGWNTKQIIAASHNPLCFSPVSKVLILCLLL